MATDSGRTRSDRQAHYGAPEAGIWPPVVTQAINRSRNRTTPNLGTPIIICAAPVRVCADHSEFPCLVVGIPPFPRICIGDLARRLIPWTAALLAGGFETSRGEALLRPPDLHSAGRTLRGNP